MRTGSETDIPLESYYSLYGLVPDFTTDNEQLTTDRGPVI